MFELLPDRLKELREEKGYTQLDVSRHIGVPKTTYANYEQGRREVSNDMLAKIASLYGVTTDYLLGLSNRRAPVSGQDGWQDIGDLTNDVHLEKQFRILGADIIKLNAELLQRGITREELERLLMAVRDLQK